jgi:hypothetical protein
MAADIKVWQGHQYRLRQATWIILAHSWKLPTIKLYHPEDLELALEVFFDSGGKEGDATLIPGCIRGYLAQGSHRDESSPDYPKYLSAVRDHIELMESTPGDLRDSFKVEYLIYEQLRDAWLTRIDTIEAYRAMPGNN